MILTENSISLKVFPGGSLAGNIAFKSNLGGGITSEQSVSLFVS